MIKTYLPFQRFYDRELANEIAATLKSNGLECIIEDYQNNVDNPFIAKNSFDAEVILKLQSIDFIKANVLLEDFYKNQIDSVDRDYYLFSFSDEQLMDVIAKPDEWGSFNYQLAKKILKDKGKNINPETFETLKQERIEALSQPKEADKATIIAGYILAFLGGIIGILIGSNLLLHKKTLPNGKKVFVYATKDRMHGKIILWLSVIMLCIGFTVRIIQLAQHESY